MLNKLNMQCRAVWVFYISTIMAIGPLLIEREWLIKGGMIIFLSGVVYLLSKPATVTFNTWEKNWIKIVLLYVTVAVLSFLLRPPYTDDGIWRLSAPGLMLLVLLWFVVVVRHQFQWHALKAVSLGIIVWGVVVLTWEQIVWQPDLLSVSYKAGMYVSGYGAMGTIIPIGAGLALAVALHERRGKLWWFLALLGLILVLLLKKRTPFVLYGVMLSVWMGWIFIRHGGLSLYHKLVMGGVLIAVLGTGAYLQRDLVNAAIRDYKVAVEQGNYVTSLGLRYKMFEVGVELIKQKPLTGWGQNGYKSEGLWPMLDKKEMQPRAKSLIAKFTHLHNQFIMDWVLYGIFGIISVLLVLFYPVYLSWRSGLDEWGTHVLLGGLGMGVVVVMFFGALFTYTYTTVAIMFALSGMVAIMARSKA